MVRQLFRKNFPDSAALQHDLQYPTYVKDSLILIISVLFYLRIVSIVLTLSDTKYKQDSFFFCFFFSLRNCWLFRLYKYCRIFYDCPTIHISCISICTIKTINMPYCLLCAIHSLSIFQIRVTQRLTPS